MRIALSSLTIAVHRDLPVVAPTLRPGDERALDKWIFISTYGSIHQAKVSNESSGTIDGGCEERFYVSKTNNVRCESTIAPNVLLDWRCARKVFC